MRENARTCGGLTSGFIPALELTFAVKNPHIPFMQLTDHLLMTARAFSEARGLSLSRVSTLVFNEGKKLRAIERGSDLSTGRFEQSMRWFSENWPDGAEWPASVPRPLVNAPCTPSPDSTAGRADTASPDPTPETSQSLTTGGADGSVDAPANACG